VTQPPAQAAPETPALLTVHLVKNGEAPDLESLTLDISSLRIRTAGLWRTVPLDQGLGPVDILAATSASPATLATAVPWPDQLSDAFQLGMGTGSTVVMATGEDTSGEEPLQVPQVLAGIMGPPGEVSPSGKATLDLWITLDVANRVVAGQDGGATLVPPVVRAFDLSRTGSVSGIVQGGDGSPLAGAAVSAQLYQAAGPYAAVPSFRAGLSDDSGNYQLDLLPVDMAWAVVGSGGGGAFAVGPPLDLGLAPYADLTCDLGLASLDLPGTVGGTASLASGIEGRVDLVVDQDAGETQGTFAVQSAEVGSGGTFAFTGVQPGTYRAVLNRLSYDPSTGVTDHPLWSASFQVGPGSAVTLNF
jgi:hypothetical protein